MRPYFEIEGGGVVHGEVTSSGNKNEALPVLAASLLAETPVVIHNVPDILDVRIMIELMRSMGASVERPVPGTVTVDARNLVDRPLDQALCSRIRTSILFAGPLLARFGHLLLPAPGGDIIGRRRLDTHALGFSALGAIWREDERGYRIEASQLTGAEIHLDEASVTATENILMAAVRAKGRTIIHNAACEPHVQGLCRFLSLLGARIEGVGTNRLIVEGVKTLRGAEHTIGPDHVEVGSLIALAAVTGGSVRIRNAAPEHLHRVRQVFSSLGIEARSEESDIVVPKHERLIVRRELHHAIPKIDDGPWPAFPSDLMSIAIVAATQAEGTILFFEKMFESRLYFVDRLIAMGAQIILCDPHRAVVSGPSPLYGTTLESPDIRAGMALVIAAIVAKGNSRINNIQQIDRGYEHIEEKLQKLGVSIRRCEEK